jgi:serine/threonine protein kinase
MGKTKARRPLRRRRTRRKPMRGGKIIGMGGSGYVHYGKEGSEVIQCSDGSEWKEGEVAKIGRTLARELERVNSIREHYPKISEFAILPTRMCETDEAKYEAFVESQPESLTKEMLKTFTEGQPEILFAPYGGTPISDVSGPEVLAALKKLRDQVRDMNEHRVYHFDIGTPNVVYKDGKAYLIDFGLASVVSEEEIPEESPDLEMMDDMILHKGARKGARRSRRKGFQRNRL